MRVQVGVTAAPDGRAGKFRALYKLAWVPTPQQGLATVPDVGGMFWDEAANMLRGAGLQAFTRYQRVACVDAPTVTWQSLPPNVRVVLGEKVMVDLVIPPKQPC